LQVLLERLQKAFAGRYTVLRELGRGGMAMVYLAHDVRNERHVAVKLLGPELATVIGADRFRREIEIAARLAHPHIVPLFDSGEADGLLYYVMPYIDGESLRRRLEREGALPLDEALRIARQVGSALSFAHQQGIVHRDIKPENILLRGDIAYVADFGVALALRSVDQERLTSTGHSLGTPAYMSPEQASGDHRLDERSDIYSLGGVLYEMMAGSPPFEGSMRAVVARILTEPPVRLRAIRPAVPEAIEAIVSRAMAKIPADRFRTVGEFVVALESGVPSTRPLLRLPRHSWMIAPLIAIMMLVAIGISRLISIHTKATPAPSLVERQLTNSGDAWLATLSPDGQHVAYITDHNSAIVVQDVRTGDTTAVIRQNNINLALGLSWSPSGRKILFNAEQPGAQEAAYYAVAPTGGVPELVATNIADMSFAGSDTTYLATFISAIYIGTRPTTFQLIGQDSAVGDGEIINLSGEVEFIYGSALSPDGRWIAVLAERAGAEVSILTVSRDGQIRNVVASSLGKPSSPFDDWFRPLWWSIDGRFLYYPKPQGLGWSIWWAAIDPRRGKVLRSPRVFAERLPTALSFGVGPRGQLAYSGGLFQAQLARYRLRPDGSIESSLQLTAGTSFHTGPAISPDGSHVAYVRQDQDGRADVFTLSIDGGQERRLTATGTRKSTVAWSPDAREVAFVEQGDSVRAVSVELASGRTTRWGEARPSTDGLRPVWSPDGRYLLYQEASNRNYAVVERNTGAERLLVPNDSVGWLFEPVFSPEGTKLLTWWHRPPYNGVWVVGFADSAQRQMPGGGGTVGDPIVWAQESKAFVGGLDSKDNVIEIVRLNPATGKQSVFTRLTTPCLRYSLSMTRDARTLVCPAVSVTSDVWIADLPAAR
jgi:serine/threonine-protein kinase